MCGKANEAGFLLLEVAISFVILGLIVHAFTLGVLLYEKQHAWETQQRQRYEAWIEVRHSE